MSSQPSSSRVRTAAPAVSEMGAPVPLALTASPGPLVGSVCTGYGGLDLGVLTARMPGVPNLGDVRTIDWTQLEPIEVLVAGFPCQDISAAGRRVGIEKGERSGLWTDIVAGIRVLRPALVVLENVAALRWRHGGFHRVLGDLAQAGYDALWRSVRAADIGAAHRRERVFLLAWPRQHAARRGNVADADRARRQLQRRLGGQQAGWPVVAGPTPSAADPACLGHCNGGTPSRARVPAAVVSAGASARGSHGVPADTSGDRRDEGLSRAAGLQGRPDAALSDHPAASPADGGRHLVAVDDHRSSVGSAHASVDWGLYTAAIHRWEHLLGRPAPHPTQPGQHGRPVLAPAFVEHLMGLSVSRENDHDRQAQSSRRSLASGGLATGPQQLSCTGSPATADVTSNAGKADDAARIDWGKYESAIRRWEAIMGRPAPYPTQPGRHGRPVLSGRFVEFLMGLDDGFVSSLDIPRTAQLRALGNGVVPQQATHAIRLLLGDLAAVLDLDSEGGRAA